MAQFLPVVTLYRDEMGRNIRVEVDGHIIPAKRVTWTAGAFERAEVTLVLPAILDTRVIGDFKAATSAPASLDIEATGAGEV